MEATTRMPTCVSKELLFVLACLLAPAAHAAPASRPVTITVADEMNLQHAVFWIAQTGGFFTRHHLTVTAKSLARPRELLTPKAPEWSVAILPPPVYLDLLASDPTVRVVATMMRGDPLSLVIRTDVMRTLPKHAANPDLPTRLRDLAGLRVGVAGGPLSRLRALWKSAGVPLDESKQVQLVRGEEQNRALHDHKVDALLAHTPFVERALLSGDGELYWSIAVHPSVGESPREGHALVVRQAFVDGNRAIVNDIVKSLDEASAWLKTHPQAAAEQLHALWPTRPVAELLRGLELLQPTWPSTSIVSVDGVIAELALFPASHTAPTLTREQIQKAILPRSK